LTLTKAECRPWFQVVRISPRYDPSTDGLIGSTVTPVEFTHTKGFAHHRVQTLSMLCEDDEIYFAVWKDGKMVAFPWPVTPVAVVDDGIPF